MVRMKIETKRLVLREVSEKDIEDIIEGVEKLAVSKWLLVVPHPYTKKDALWWINDCKKKAKKKERTSYDFVIELKSEKKMIGGIGLTKIDKFSGICSTGYWINPKYHRKGYASEAFDALLKFAFNKLKLRRINSSVFKGNPSSLILQKKFGFKEEGFKEKSKRAKADGKLKDEIITGLLKKDWRSWDEGKSKNL